MESLLQGVLAAILAGICIRMKCAIFVDGGATCKRYYNVPPPNIIYKPSQKRAKMRRVAAKRGSTFAKQAQNAKGEMYLAMEPPSDELVSGVRTATANQPSQKNRNLRRMATKIASTFANTPQFAQGGNENRFNLRKTDPKREGSTNRQQLQLK